MNSYDLIALAAILLLGIPHGGLDGAIARRVGWSTSLPAWVGFHLVYIALALTIVVLWQWLPLLCLALFLALSAIHFGRSDQAVEHRSDWLPVLAHGGLVPLVIPFFQSQPTHALFALLVGPNNATALLGIVELLIIPWGLILLWYAYRAIDNADWQRPLSVLIVLILAAALLPPLVSFAVYFCLLHSPRHLLYTLSKLSTEERRRSLVEAMIYSGIAIGAIVGSAIWLQNSPQLTPTLLQTGLIGIAALTVPHMLLVDCGSRLTGRHS